ncbi:MAG: SDR family oxidoreductase [Rhodothermales bacterium]
MNLGLQDRTALVTGASSGLGRATAIALAREGVRVGICSRNSVRIHTAAVSVADAAGVSRDRVLPLVCDVTDEAAIHTAVDEVVSTYGGLDILVCNAGGPPAGTVDDFNADDWRMALELNLVSTINLTRAALPHLRAAAARPDGLARILMITSLSAKQPVAGLYLSNVSRAGVQGFAKSLSEELGPEGITVNTILPGYTRTDRLTDLATSLSERRQVTMAEVEDGWAAMAALRRIGTEQEFAAAAAFLVSRPAGYITGVALPVDGGAIKSLL